MTDYQPSDLADADSVAVRAAVKEKCGICQVEPLDLCKDIVSEQLLYAVVGRWVHGERVPR